MTHPTTARTDPTEIAGRYQVVLKLGAGAFGTVYKARDRVLGRLVAIKTIRLDGLAASAASLDELLARFRREAQVSAQLKHPNIVTIYDIGEAQGLSYIAMEFIDGLGLDKVIAGAGRLPLDRALAIAAQIADALDYAHRNNVVHRDIKPANVMIEAGDRVKVTDFGIAKAIDSGEHLTVTGSLLGTPSYMSPEQARGGTVDGRSDLFSVGCILYEMLTGKKAFVGESITALIFKIITEEPPSLRGVEPSIPEPVVRIIARALSKAPETRHATGRELAMELLAISSPAAVPTLRQVEAPTVVSPAGDSTRMTPRAPAASTQVSPPTHAATRRPVPPPLPRPPRAGRGVMGLVLVVGALLLVGVTVLGGLLWWVFSRQGAGEGTTVATLDAGASPTPVDVAATPADTTGSVAEVSPAETPVAGLEWAGADLEPTPEPSLAAVRETPPPAFVHTPRPTPVAAAERPTPARTPAPTAAESEAVEDDEGNVEGDADVSPAARVLRRAAARRLERLASRMPGLASRRGERAALETLAIFNAAQQEYHKTNGRYATPAELRTGQSIDMMASTSDSFMRRGYRFTVNVGASGYSVTAMPLKPGLRGFATDQSGEIRALD